MFEELTGLNKPESRKTRSRKVILAAIAVVILIGIVLGICVVHKNQNAPSAGNTVPMESGNEKESDRNPEGESEEGTDDDPDGEDVSDQGFVYEVSKEYIKENVEQVFRDIPAAVGMAGLDIESTAILCTVPEFSEQNFEIWIEENHINIIETREEITDRGVRPGDTVIVRMEASNNGESSFEGDRIGEYTVSLTDPATAVLIGHMAGEEFEADVHFPIDYMEENMAGQYTHYRIHLESILQVVSSDAMTDEDAVNLGYQSLDEYLGRYREYFRSLQETDREMEIRSKVNALYMGFVATEDIPVWLREQREKDIREDVLSGFVPDLYPSVDLYLKDVYGLTMEEYERFVREASIDLSKAFMITAWVISGDCPYLDIPYEEIAANLGGNLSAVWPAKGITNEEDAKAFFRSSEADDELRYAAYAVIYPALVEYGCEHASVRTIN